MNGRDPPTPAKVPLVVYLTANPSVSPLTANKETASLYYTSKQASKPLCMFLNTTDGTAARENDSWQARAQHELEGGRWMLLCGILQSIRGKTWHLKYPPPSFWLWLIDWLLSQDADKAESSPSIYPIKKQTRKKERKKA